MLTEKEIKFLNFLYKKLGGKHLSTFELVKFIEDKIRLNKEKSYELAYLYDKNFEKANGDFSNVTEPEREKYEGYWDSISDTIKIIMSYTKDENLNNYEDDGYNTITHDGTEYRIESFEELYSMAVENSDWLCDDPQEWAESYVYMNDYERAEFADEAADSYFDNLDDEEIIDRGNIRDQLEELERQRNDSENNESEEDIEEKRQQIIDEERERLRQEYSDEIYDELENPVEYFISNGIYNSIRQLVRSGPVEFDCDSAKDDYFRDADYEMIVNNAGYSNYEPINDRRGEYFIVWN